MAIKQEKIFMHENKVVSKGETKYSDLLKTYRSFRTKVDVLKFTKTNHEAFKKAATLFWEYYCDIRLFETKNNINHQAALASSFLEEINVYLFRELPEIKSGLVSLYGGKVFAGVTFDKDYKLKVNKKHWDFSIVRKDYISSENSAKEEVVLPVVAVEVKTYLDSTMFSGIQFASNQLNLLLPYSKNYTLAGYINLEEGHLIASLSSSSVNDVFKLSDESWKDRDFGEIKSQSFFKAEYLYDYWCEVANAVANSVNFTDVKIESGRLLRPELTVPFVKD